jgi:hypothetical protein
MPTSSAFRSAASPGRVVRMAVILTCDMEELFRYAAARSLEHQPEPAPTYASEAMTVSQSG